MIKPKNIFLVLCSICSLCSCGYLYPHEYNDSNIIKFPDRYCSINTNYTLTANVTPSNATGYVTWKSSDSSKVVVSGNDRSATIKRISNYDSYVTITASIGSLKATCNVYSLKQLADPSVTAISTFKGTNFMINNNNDFEVTYVVYGVGNINTFTKTLTISANRSMTAGIYNDTSVSLTINSSCDGYDDSSYSYYWSSAITGI